MSTKSPQPDPALVSLVRDVVGELGFDLEEVAVNSAGRKQVVRVVIDTREAAENADTEGTRGIDLDDIAAASRAVSTVLDEHEDVLAGPYTLEVTSPGVDRPLTTPKHWRRNRFRLARVRLTGGESLVGRIGDVSDGPAEAVALLVDNTVRQIRLADIEHAVVEVEFRQPPASELAALDLPDAWGGTEE